jgi:hypothetical protein
MYKKRSGFMNGRPLYGWSTGNYTKPNECNSGHGDPHFTGGMNRKIRESKKNGLYWLTDEDRQHMIEEYWEKNKK